MDKFLFVVFAGLLFFSCKLVTNTDRQFGNTEAAKTYRLHLSPAIGSVYQYDSENETDIVLKLNDEETHVVNRVTVGTNYTIDKDSSGNFLITVAYNKIQLYSKNGDSKSELDATNAASSENPVEKMLGILKNARIVATVSPAGEIKQVTGNKELSDSILATFTPGSSAAERETAQKQWNQMVGEGVIRKNLDQLFQLFPDSAIHVGDKWKMDASQKGEISLKVKAIYTLKDIDNDKAVINVGGTLISDSTSSSVMNMQVNTQLQGGQEGEYEVDTKTGMLANENITATAAGTIQVMGRDVPVTIKTRTTVTGKKIRLGM